MGVPTWQRELSRTQYIYETHQLCVFIGHTVGSLPKKYRYDYGSKLINDSLDCLKYCRLANAIFVKKGMDEGEYKMRRRFLQEAKVLSYHISTVADIYLTLCWDSGEADKKKLIKRQQAIGSKTAAIRNAGIRGIYHYDRRDAGAGEFHRREGIGGKHGNGCTDQSIYRKNGAACAERL